ncbi:outer membrane protein assembly factor BamD [Luteibacter sp. Sphag1AF]|uniref:outer membrane protein assembly factor BamD n=1 Tax=Luteibacter sp. Sphag1AF TaxID=2587031 RepID=UPI0016093472|nr:outer membrane protein assembly factor BamD [Luteibacter sp. Sphag1AF]
MRATKLIILLALALATSACSMFRHKGETIDTMPVDKLYANAHDSLENSDFAAAEKAYQRLIARFPSGDINEQAQIELAYAQYKDNKPEDAYSTINRFIKTFPTHKHADYAYYLRGLINFDRTGGLIERYLGRESATTRRDQGYNLQSFDDFSQLTRRYPNSAYATDARQRMIFLRNQLAQFEVNVAEYYVRVKAYIAAANRSQYVIEHYQQSPETADALALLTRSYIGLDRPALADQTRKVLALNYPNHPYLTDDKWPHAPSIWRKAIPFSGHH